jgi:glycosyltransferase involved in cell wall biosynthesis
MTPPPLLRENVSLLTLQPPTAYGLPVEVNHYRFQHQIAQQVLDQLQSKPELLYQRMSVANYAGVTLSRRLRVPLVLEYNGSEVWAARHWGTPLKYEEAALAAEDVSLRHAHLVVTVSTVLGDELRERGVDPRRLVVYPNGVDPVQYNPERFTEADRAALRARYDVPADALVVGFIGTFGAWHGVERLAEAIRLLVDEAPDWVERNRVYFMLVGDGLRMRDVSAMLAPPSYARLVRLPGLVPQSEGALHLAASDVLVSPHVPNANGSPFFGSPTKLFEYMAMGRAIVASDLNQIGEVLRAGGEPVALLTPPGDPRAIADAIRRLIEHPELRHQLGQAARQLVLDRFTWERHVEAIMKQAHDVIDTR